MAAILLMSNIKLISFSTELPKNCLFLTHGGGGFVPGWGKNADLKLCFNYYF